MQRPGNKRSYTKLPAPENPGSIREKHIRSNRNIPGLLYTELLAREYDELLAKNGLPKVHPVPEGDEKGLAQYNRPGMYYQILADAREKRTKGTRQLSIRCPKGCWPAPGYIIVYSTKHLGSQDLLHNIRKYLCWLSLRATLSPKNGLFVALIAFRNHKQRRDWYETTEH
ncbi:hypothetical protein F5Y04DRAFT_92457 [Hypomontagnella monticulosa]|nr:hypothetical protein F5Y04DRAFT_92457 [Hypomontagnella monticulosa]